MADVFLSYARSDAAAASAIARWLGKAGCSVWYDRELPAHGAYADVIAGELETAKAVLVLWSKASINSEWVRSEANKARELHKLVQGRIDNSRLPMPFDQTQCADLRNWRVGRRVLGWKQVSSGLEALLGANPISEPVFDLTTNRRRLLTYGGAILVATATGAWLWRGREDDAASNPQAALLLQKGIDMLQNNDVFAADNPGSLKDAAALLTEATQADPRSSTAWGSLALAYAALKRVSPPTERAGFEERSRSAATKALGIDPQEPRAIGSLLLMKPLYRNWASAERADREALQRFERPMPLLLFVMSEMLRSVGRCKEAAATSTKFDRRAFIIPGADEQVLIDLWSAGDLQGADEAQRLAVQHWPQHPDVWTSRLSYLMYSGRAAEAVELLGDQAQRPANTSAARADAMEATATALAGRLNPQDAIAKNLGFLRADPRAAFVVTHACAALGDLRNSFAIMNGYYFGEGPWKALAPAAGDQDRQTDELFQPPMKAAWKDPHFGQLVQRIGLENYWRQSGTSPDFRTGGT